MLKEPLSLLLKTSPLDDQLALYDIVNTQPTCRKSPPSPRSKRCIHETKDRHRRIKQQCRYERRRSPPMPRMPDPLDDFDRAAHEKTRESLADAEKRKHRVLLEEKRQELGDGGFKELEVVELCLRLRSRGWPSPEVPQEMSAGPARGYRCEKSRFPENFIFHFVLVLVLVSPLPDTSSQRISESETGTSLCLRHTDGISQPSSKFALQFNGIQLTLPRRFTTS